MLISRSTHHSHVIATAHFERVHLIDRDRAQLRFTVSCVCLSNSITKQYSPKLACVVCGVARELYVQHVRICSTHIHTVPTQLRPHALVPHCAKCAAIHSSPHDMCDAQRRSVWSKTISNHLVNNRAFVGRHRSEFIQCRGQYSAHPPGIPNNNASRASYVRVRSALSRAGFVLF